MPSSNPRYYNYSARQKARGAIIARVAAGEPCGLCGKPIDLSLPQTFRDRDGKVKRAPWSLEVDEIVPVSKGGSPTDLANLQPAHRLCNQRAGNKAKRFKPIVYQPKQLPTVEGTTSQEW